MEKLEPAEKEILVQMEVQVLVTTHLRPENPSLSSRQAASSPL
jgi:hypothetical protein